MLCLHYFTVNLQWVIEELTFAETRLRGFLFKMSFHNLDYHQFPNYAPSRNRPYAYAGPAINTMQEWPVKRWFCAGKAL